MNNNNNSSGGIGFCGLLTIVFIVLKLLNIITWSWVWVFAPFWIPFSLIAFTLFIIFFISSCGK